jgi:hypothetical protein
MHIKCGFSGEKRFSLYWLAGISQVFQVVLRLRGELLNNGTLYALTISAKATTPAGFIPAGVFYLST